MNKMGNFRNDNCWFTLQRALFYNDMEKVKEMIESPLFTEELLINCGDFSEIGEKVPFYYITQLWNELLPGDWGYIQDIVDEQKKRLAHITEYLNSRFDIRTDLPLNVLTLKNINYNRKYTANKILEELSDEDIMTRAKVVDIELNCATRNFDFDETERLLQLGANPMIELEKDDPTTSAYGDAYDDLLERDWWQDESLRDKRDYTGKFKFMNICAMISSALKGRMVKLLNKYEKLETL